MLAAELVPGHDYAQRPRHRDPACALMQMRFVGPARAGKAKIRHCGGELAGLEEWVPTRTLLCPWPERSRFLRDETRRAALEEAAARDHDPVVEEAISTVFEATGDETGFTRIWSVNPERAGQLWRRAGLDGTPDQHPLAYTDRHGQLNLPYETALMFAQTFAAAEPEPCIHYIQEWEDRLRAEGYQPGQRHRHSALRDMLPAHALVREWARAGELDLLRKRKHPTAPAPATGHHRAAPGRPGRPSQPHRPCSPRPVTTAAHTTVGHRPFNVCACECFGAKITRAACRPAAQRTWLATACGTCGAMRSVWHASGYEPVVRGAYQPPPTPAPAARGRRGSRYLPLVACHRRYSMAACA